MKRRILAVLTAVSLLGLTQGCGKTETGEESASETASETEEDAASDTEFTQTDADMFTDRDLRTDYDEDECVQIRLDGDSATADSDSVEISGTTITITEEASYIISGTLDDGMIIVNADDTAKIQLIFDGVSINSATSAPLYILEADKVFVTLAEESENELSNGGSFEAIDDNNIDAVIFSKQDLTLNGSGTLTVTSPAGHGIVAKDDLVITGGTYEISAASHGLQVNDSVRITGDTSLTIDAGKDGIHAENDDDDSLGFVYISGGTADIEAEGDGISAGAYMQITDGSFNILAGGGNENGTKESSESWGSFPGGEMPGGAGPGGAEPGGEGRNEGGLNSDTREKQGEQTGDTLALTEPADITELEGSSDSTDTTESSTSMKGLKASGDMQITGGEFTIDSADDAIHSNASIKISGGSFNLASGDDAVHADDTLTISEGTINISTSYEGLEALHVDIQGGDITLTASDDGVNAAGGTDSSGTEGGRDGMFGDGGRMEKDGARAGAPGDAGSGSSSDGTITISGGTLYITASGDGIDANGSLSISGGYTVVTGPTQGDTATLDYDTTAVITGGTFIGTGASGMAQTFSDSEQGVISVSAGKQSAGTEITLTDSEGNTLISCTPELDYNVVILSSPDIESGQSYTLTAGDVSGEVEAA